MKRSLKNILVTGGCGFIGGNFIRYILNNIDFDGRIINLDTLTYAGNLENLKDIEDKECYKNRYYFEKENILDFKKIIEIIHSYEIDVIVNFAAETHVDRSIIEPGIFVKTNISGTYSLLEAARKTWSVRGYYSKDVLFHQISTDEVYGSLKENGFFYENSIYDPRSPYSASKAAGDHLCLAYYYTYGLPVTISNCSNNYGPYQFPEKLIPFMILNILESKSLPVYGNGKNIRDWVYVDDHSSAIFEIIKNGKPGKKYNVGGENAIENIVLLKKLIEVVAKKTGRNKEDIEKKIVFVADRLGHDKRYAVNCDKIKKELKWGQKVDFATGLEKTVDWYLNNIKWIENIKNGEYKTWFIKNYTLR
jgi:dTDP-glucose 4,6-dehydratase